MSCIGSSSPFEAIKKRAAINKKVVALFVIAHEMPIA